MTTLAPPAGIHIGPTTVPERTLGWEILGWTKEYLLQPDGPNAGEPWVFTNEQARFILNWYAVDEHGRFVWRYGMLRRMKGWGKDPVGAAICCIEFIGPCRFDRWDGKEPVAKSQAAAWIQIAAVTHDQVRTTTMLFPGMFSRKAVEDYGIDLGKEIFYAEGGRRRIETVTTSARAQEGSRATLILKNETHHWLAPNEGHEMSKVIARNSAKVRDSRVLAISNAHAPGENSDAQHDWEAWQKIDQGISKATGLLYDCLEAPGETDLEDDESLLAGLLAARGDSAWVDPDRLIAEIHDPRTEPAVARRFYLNQIVAQEDKPFDSNKWETLAGHRVVPDGALITLGFDGSISQDHTALIGTEPATGHQWVVGYWEPEVMDGGEVRIPFMEVDETVDATFQRWKVWRFNCDPFYWKDMTAAWAGRYGDDVVVNWATNQYRRMAAALLAYRNAIETGALSHDGDARFTAAIYNAHKHMREFRDDQGERMWTIQKERPDSPLKIDAAMAGCLSWEASLAAIAAGAVGDEEEAGVMFV